MKYALLEETLFFHFATNNTSGSGADGTSPAAHVRECGAIASNAPILSPTPVLLSHASYPDGCYEVAIAATTVNGFEAGKEYAVFCTIAVDLQNPTGFIGSFKLSPVLSNTIEVGGFAEIDGATIAAILARLGAIHVGKTSNDGKTARSMADDRDAIVGTLTGKNRTSVVYNDGVYD